MQQERITEHDLPVTTFTETDTGLLIPGDTPGRRSLHKIQLEAVEPEKRESTPPEPVSTTKKKKEQKPEGLLAKFFFAVNRPWLLITIPLIGGMVWLAQNSWVITNNLDKPYTLLAGPVALASIGAFWIVVVFFKTIASWCRACWQAFQEWRKQDGAIFWMVIVVFLIVSIAEAGTFFNELLKGNDLYGTLGYAIAGVIDLVAVMAMRARLVATRLHDKAGQQLYLVIIVLCASMSAFANAYTALDHASMLPDLMRRIAPWTSIVVPSLIIALSFAAEYTADQGANKLDPEKFWEQEQKRIRYLDYKVQGIEQRVAREQRLKDLHSQIHPQKAALIQAREEGRIEYEKIRATRLSLWELWFTRPAPVAGEPTVQEQSLEKKARTRTEAIQSQILEESEGDSYDPRRSYQILGGLTYYTKPKVKEFWGVSPDILDKVLEEYPEIKARWYRVYQNGNVPIPMLRADDRAKEEILKAIEDRKARPRTRNTGKTSEIPVIQGEKEEVA